jgi:integrase
MSVRREQRRDPATGTVREFYMVDVDYQHADGTRTRVRKVSPVQTRRGAEQYERDLRQAILDGSYDKKEVPTFDDWFNNRFWREWVIGRKNKPGEAQAKKSVYKNHLKHAFGQRRLDEIGTAQIASFRASLVEKQLTEKTINNILAVLSKPLHYAVEAEILTHAPKIGLLKVERPEIVCWEMTEYARLLAAARDEAAEWYAAACLAGEAGLRVGEVKALRWREDVDLVAATVTLNQQVRHGVIGTPKGRTRRTIPMTTTLLSALKSLDVVRSGYVIRNLDGSHMSDSQARDTMYRICRRAGLPERGWHVLRHSFGTHSAMLGVNPWRLQTWMGHKRIDETMLYVNFAEAHMRPTPASIVQSGARELDADKRILLMLSARGNLTATENVQQEKGEATSIVS